MIAGAEPGATVELRTGGDVIDEATANRAGVAILTGVADGTYVLRQVVDGNPGLRTSPVTVQR